MPVLVVETRKPSLANQSRCESKSSKTMSLPPAIPSPRMVKEPFVDLCQGNGDRLTCQRGDRIIVSQPLHSALPTGTYAELQKLGPRQRVVKYFHHVPCSVRLCHTLFPC